MSICIFFFAGSNKKIFFDSFQNLILVVIFFLLFFLSVVFLCTVVQWSAYFERIYGMLQDWFHHWVKKGYGNVNAVVITIINHSKQPIKINASKTAPPPEIAIPNISSSIVSVQNSSSSNVGGWHENAATTLLFGSKGNAASNKEESSTSSSSSSTSTGSKLSIRFVCNLFHFKLFENGAALLLPIHDQCIVSLSTRRQYHNFTELVLIVNDN